MPTARRRTVPLWATWLGQPRRSGNDIDMFATNDPEWGILSTPVISDDRKTLYVVAWHDDAAQGIRYKLHALLLAYAFILTSEGYPAVYHKDYAQERGCYGLKPWIDNLVWIHEHLANGTTLTRWADDKVIVTERQGWPGLLTAISSDTWNHRSIGCQTSFPPGTQLHDYTGRHGDIWTDGQGRASFTVPSNAFGSGQSYLCFSRTGQDNGPQLHGHPAQQNFFGAADLDIAGLANGKAVTLPRIYSAAHAAIQVGLAMDRSRWTDATTVTLEVSSGGGEVARHSWNSSSGQGFDFRAGATGWHTLQLTATGLPKATPFEVDVHYTAPQTL